MNEYVELYFKRNRGWPWPEDSWGLASMFGEDGWCHACGVPKGAQSGPLVLQRKGLKIEGAWVPNWQFDTICLERAAVTDLVGVDLSLRKVEWRGDAPGEALQIVVPTVGDAWFDHDELRARATAIHGSAGSKCGECATWRWMPLAFENLPPLRLGLDLGGADIAGSPEWFGDGWNAYRQVLVRRPLAELLVALSPRDFKILPVK